MNENNAEFSSIILLKILILELKLCKIDGEMGLEGSQLERRIRKQLINVREKVFQTIMPTRASQCEYCNGASWRVEWLGLSSALSISET